MTSGFEVTVVSADSTLFATEWIGRKVDGDFLKYLKEKNITSVEKMENTTSL
jgi:diphthamide synthase (EF-2-diphthine--ammonia ligase)